MSREKITAPTSTWNDVTVDGSAERELHVVYRHVMITSVQCPSSISAQWSSSTPRPFLSTTPQIHGLWESGTDLYNILCCHY